jgi:hypothetical protein
MSTQLLIQLPIFLVVGAVAAYLYSRRKQRRGPRIRGVAEFVSLPVTDARELAPGGEVELDGRAFTVQGSLRFEDGGDRWQEHLLVDEEDRVWLTVAERDDDELDVALWRRLAEPTITPDGETVEHEGITYELVDRGRARYRGDGKPGAPPSGTAEYVDYFAGERRLAFERFRKGGKWEVMVGRAVAYDLVDPDGQDAEDEEAAAAVEEGTERE